MTHQEPVGPDGPDVVDIIAPAPSPRSGRRTLWVVAILVAAVVALGAGVAWLGTRGGTSAASGEVCPTSMRNGSADADGRVPRAEDLVPATPTVPGLDRTLVPDTAPTSLVLCEYRTGGGGIVVRGIGPGNPIGSGAGTPQPGNVSGGSGDDIPLARSAEHDGGDAAVAPLIAMLQQATVQDSGYYSCVSYGGINDVPPQYLVRLTYADGVVWVAGPVACATTNGSATSVLDLTGSLTAALDDPTGAGFATPS